MTPPRLVACYFSAGQDGLWRHLARVLAFTAAEHCATWSIEIPSIAPTRMASPLGIRSIVDNCQKMEHWHRVVANAADGDRLLLIDADTMILRSLDDIWARDFDMAYTVKACRFPFNAGVIFLRISPTVRQVIAAWHAENLQMLRDPGHHQVWRKKYGGINQAALGHLLERGDLKKLAVLGLPCLEWNCENAHWARFDPAVTRIVHLKDQLRRACFQKPRTRPVPEFAPLVDRWRALDARATAAALARAS